MRRREFLASAATLAGIGHANAFGIGKLGAGFGHGGAIGKATSLPPVPVADLTNYRKGNWTLFLNPYNAAGFGLTGSDSATVYPSSFPNGTVCTWSWTPSRTPGAPIGFNQLAIYGDYFNTSALTPIVSALVNDISALSTTFNYAHTGPANSHVVCFDWFLTRAPNAHSSATFTGTGSGTNLTVTGPITGTIYPGQSVGGTGVPAGTTILSQTSGTTGGAGVYVTSAATTSSGAALTSSDHLCEIQVYLGAPTYIQNYVNGLSAQLGTVTISGITYKVARDDTANGGVYPDFLFMPNDLADKLSGTLDKNALHAWLISQSQLPNVGYYNGDGFGVEPTTDNGTLTLNSISTTYTQGVLPAGFYNFTGSNLPNLASAMLAQRTGVSRALIMPFGDSTVAGQGGTGNGLASNPISQSWPTQLANMLPNGSWQNSFCNQNAEQSGGTFTAFDTRWTNSTWVVSGGSSALGGKPIICQSPNTGALSFTPPTVFDTIEYWRVGGTPRGWVTVDVDGGAPLATINTDTGATVTFDKSTISCARGTHTVNFKRTTTNANQVYKVAVMCYDSTKKETMILNSGAVGLNAAQLNDTANAASSVNAVKAIAPNLVICEMGIVNDWKQQTTRSAVIASQTAMVNAFKAQGIDVILMSGPPSNQIVSTMTGYVDDMKALAYTLGVPFINVFEIFGSAFNSPLMYDTYHCNQAGYAKIMQAAILPILNPARASAT